MDQPAADGYDIKPGGDQRRGVRVAQGMKVGRRQLAIPYGMAPIARELVGRVWRAIRYRRGALNPRIAKPDANCSIGTGPLPV